MTNTVVESYSICSVRFYSVGCMHRHCNTNTTRWGRQKPFRRQESDCTLLSDKPRCCFPKGVQYDDEQGKTHFWLLYTLYLFPCLFHFQFDGCLSDVRSDEIFGSTCNHFVSNKMNSFRGRAKLRLLTRALLTFSFLIEKSY